MDFASIMKAQIAKSAKSKDAKSDSTPISSAPVKSDPTTAPKYLRRGEAEAQRLEAYHKEQEATEAARLEKLLKRQRDEDEERDRAALRAAKKARLAEESRVQREQEEREQETARRKRLGLPPLPDPGDADNGGAGTDDDSDIDDARLHTGEIPDDELRVKLRGLSQPVTLFAESHAARLRRYHKLTAPVERVSDGPIPTTIPLLPAAELDTVPAKPPGRDDSEGRKVLFRRLASYFVMVFTNWEAALAARPADIKASSTGRQALVTYESARAAMVPLFRLFEKAEREARKRARKAGNDGSSSNSKQVPPSQHSKYNNSNKNNNNDDENSPIPAAVLEGIVEIVHAAQLRRYVAASDAYLRLSIGKAAWPIGVTMVGIHERSAREKLHEGDGGRKAHIMSDEATRKYLQAIKSCLAFAQTRWPPDDHLQLMG